MKKNICSLLCLLLLTCHVSANEHMAWNDQQYQYDYGVELDKPSNIPSVTGGSYHPIGSTVNLDLTTVPNATSYKVYMSKVDSNYQLPCRIQIGKL